MMNYHTVWTLRRPPTRPKFSIEYHFTGIISIKTSFIVLYVLLRIRLYSVPTNTFSFIKKKRSQTRHLTAWNGPPGKKHTCFGRVFPKYIGYFFTLNSLQVASFEWVLRVLAWKTVRKVCLVIMFRWSMDYSRAATFSMCSW